MAGRQGDYARKKRAKTIGGCQIEVSGNIETAMKHRV
jgi:hypothetical protein